MNDRLIKQQQSLIDFFEPYFNRARKDYEQSLKYLPPGVVRSKQDFLVNGLVLAEARERLERELGIDNPDRQTAAHAYSAGSMRSSELTDEIDSGAVVGSSSSWDLFQAGPEEMLA